ncbi:hypothetical protein [Luteolibacter soli]|uniref:HEAT repeat domain-containing protein n=1 Tax=Luteolibacter soli TaxID=3135280 RepID=A0ABU9AZJ1_9BACT
MSRFVYLVLLLAIIAGRAEEALWEDNKLTPGQPFPGRVMAVESSWGGYRLVIESIGEGDKAYCIAQAWPGGQPHLNYKVIQKADLPVSSSTMIYLNPAIEVGRFSWSMGPWKIGEVFGDDDCLKKAVAMDPATANRQDEPIFSELMPGRIFSIPEEGPTDPVELKKIYDHYTGSKFADIAHELAKRVSEQLDLRGYIPEEKLAEPWTDSLQLTLSQAWRYQMDSVARKETYGEKFGTLMSVLEDPKVGQGRMYALAELHTRIYWGNQHGDKSLPPMEETLARLSAIALNKAEGTELRLALVPILYEYGDPNEYLDLAIELSSLEKKPHRMAEAFRLATPVTSADRLTKANRAKFLNHAFELLRRIDDKKSGTGYFLAGHIGNFVGVSPVRDGQGAFSPDQTLPEYRVDHGLTESFFQKSVDNAMEWWMNNWSQYQGDQGGGEEPASHPGAK